MRKVKLFVVLLLFPVFFAACSSAETVSSDMQNAAVPSGEPELSTLQNEGGGGGGGKNDDGKVSVSSKSQLPVQNQVSLETADKNQAEPEKPVERKIIRNAELQLESDKPDEAQQKISEIAARYGGFVVESKKQSSDVSVAETDTITLTIRVPAEKFEQALAEIRKIASRVIVETVKGQDVTEEFIDLQARLGAKKALEQQFIEIMKRSNSVEDALNVQRELANVRGEIEQIEGRKRFLENQASLSTINITLQTPMAIAGSSKGFFYRLTDAISYGFDGALSFVLGFVTILIAVLPFLLLIVLPIYLVLRYFWRKSKKRKLAAEIVREEVRE